VKHIKSCVDEEGLLEDEMINGYLFLLQQREHQLQLSAQGLGTKKKKIKMVDTFFFKTLCGDSLQT
jgi:hypothetical protein